MMISYGPILNAYFDYLTHSVRVAMIRMLPSGKKQALKMPEQLEWVDFDESCKLPNDCELVINREFFMNGFLDSLERAIREASTFTHQDRESLNQSKMLEAKLEAVKYHLEDMRRLVFKESE